jgi:hypothetical protein
VAGEFERLEYANVHTMGTGHVGKDANGYHWFNRARELPTGRWPCGEPRAYSGHREH